MTEGELRQTVKKLIHKSRLVSLSFYGLKILLFCFFYRVLLNLKSAEEEQKPVHNIYSITCGGGWKSARASLPLRK